MWERTKQQEEGRGYWWCDGDEIRGHCWSKPGQYRLERSGITTEDPLGLTGLTGSEIKLKCCVPAGQTQGPKDERI